MGVLFIYPVVVTGRTPTALKTELSRGGRAARGRDYHEDTKRSAHRSSKNWQTGKG